MSTHTDFQRGPLGADGSAPSLRQSRRFSVAPMMDWTDRHCRYLHRLLTRHGLLFTEMVNSGAVVHGDAERHLRFDDVEHPVALQLGGSDPRELAEASRIATTFGYDEINLNVGCPSDRVQSGRFGACLMAEPELVADCVRAMRDATDRPVTVKCRIGIDDQDTEESLDRFADAMVAAGVDALYVHARKAWLKGLSPKENRTIPPLDYPRVYRLRQRLAPLPVMINGGIETLEQVAAHLPLTDGVMLGRAAYHNPMLLADIDRLVFGVERDSPGLEALIAAMADYAEGQLAEGQRLNGIARHMLGLANGRPGARQFRQVMSVDACRKGAGPEVFLRALAAVDLSDLARAG
ncbi:MAG: tRNA dihydrouridine(20/20a) synthase DusA [Devosia sp.]|uniref:tRNA dihydrouridine(20/20a) synthase DusA n=1 Tax=Devosia sp. TaxID=1871048 RepID=UPI0024C6C2C9|nr:tRNA dihydrouridine(20/20a) synthase DusA [Devosia sp.]UYN99733.1 MAG: tRNA dihydrouridine(20/20a) synthase DusA [Devosia sp.]